MLDTLKPTLTNKYLNRMMRAHSEFNKFKDYTEKEREHLIEEIVRKTLDERAVREHFQTLAQCQIADALTAQNRSAEQ